jgi:hypothetical protein
MTDFTIENLRFDTEGCFVTADVVSGPPSGAGHALPAGSSEMIRHTYYGIPKRNGSEARAQYRHDISG